MVQAWKNMSAKTVQAGQNDGHGGLPGRSAIIRAVRLATGFQLDDLTFVLRHFLPHFNHDRVWGIVGEAFLPLAPANSQT